MRKPDKLKIINMYPKNSSDNRKKDEVVTAAMRFIKSKSTENYFIALTMMVDGWEYRTTRIMEKTGLTEAQVSKAKKDCIRLGLITVDDSKNTIDINYSKLSSDLHMNLAVVKSKTPEKIEVQSKCNESYDEDKFGRFYPDCLGGGLIE